MKYILLLTIKLYWFAIAENNRRNCLFEESCSKYVYRITSKNGLISGLRAFYIRFRYCRPGYTVNQNSEDNFIYVTTKNGTCKIPIN